MHLVTGAEVEYLSALRLDGLFTDIISIFIHQRIVW